MGVFKEPRLEREYKTIVAMIELYCQKNHNLKNGLCSECKEMVDYARLRLTLCPFGKDKPTCVNCHVHCYKPQMREKIRLVMRFSGPKLLWCHPILTIRHLLDNKKCVSTSPHKIPKN